MKVTCTGKFEERGWGLEGMGWGGWGGITDTRFGAELLLGQVRLLPSS